MDHGAGMKDAPSSQIPTPRVLTIKPTKIARAISGNLFQNLIIGVGLEKLSWSFISKNLGDGLKVLYLIDILDRVQDLERIYPIMIFGILKAFAR